MPFNSGEIQVLSCQAAQFTVDNTVNSVAPAFALADFVNPGGDGDLQPRENVLLLSYWVTLPYCFSFADTQIVLEMDWEDTAGNFGIIEEIGNSGLFVPVENVETSLNIYIPWPNATFDNNTHFRGQVAIGDVSMINAPDSLNGETLPIWAYIKILSTFGVV